MSEFSADQKEIAKKLWGKDFAKSTKEDEKVKYISYIETPEYILEQVINTEVTEDTEVTIVGNYIKFDKGTGTTEEVEDFYYNNVHHKPIVDDLVTTGTIQLPSGVEEYGDTDLLVKDIREFLCEYFELPTFYEKFIPYLALFYWTYERFPFVPYLHFVGRTGTGKSTAMEVFGSLCYKAIDASGAITMASIFRTASKWRGTLLLDEFTASGDNYQEMISFLKSGVSNKAVLRVEGEKEKEVRAYMIKSPKLFTSETPITDAGLQSRTIVIKMEKNKRRIPLYRLKRYSDDALKLRNKLLLWRMRNLNKIDLSKIEYGFADLEGFDRRVQQVITPIYYFSSENVRNDVLEFAKEQQEETMRERRESLEGSIFAIICMTWDVGGEVQIKEITAKLNVDRGSQGFKTDITEKKVGSIVRKILGFDTETRGYEKLAWVIRDVSKEKELRNYYGTPIPEQTSVTSVPSVKAIDGHLDTEDSFGEKGLFDEYEEIDTSTIGA